MCWHLIRAQADDACSVGLKRERHVAAGHPLLLYYFVHSVEIDVLTVQLAAMATDALSVILEQRCEQKPQLVPFLYANNTALHQSHVF